MFARVALLACLSLLVPLAVPALAAAAAPASTVEGVLRLGKEKVALKHVRAHYHDNTEGSLDVPHELRVALTDRPVAAEALQGLEFLPINDLARRGEVRGLLIRFDPANPNQVYVTRLEKPEEEGMTLITQTRSTTGADLWKSFHYADGQAAGELVDDGDDDADDGWSYRFKFTSPVVNEPAVTADLKGKAAQASPQVTLLKAKAKAMAAGDMDAMQKLSSTRAWADGEERMKAMNLSPEAVKAMMKQYGPEMIKAVGSIQRVVVRGERAVALAPSEGGSQWFNFVLEDGQWKSDD